MREHGSFWRECRVPWEQHAIPSLCNVAGIIAKFGKPLRPLPGYSHPTDNSRTLIPLYSWISYSTGDDELKLHQ